MVWMGHALQYVNPATVGTASEGKNTGTKQHPSVPNTGYNMVPIAALPYTDYSTPLGDHLTLAVKEKIEWENTLIFMSS